MTRRLLSPLPAELEHVREAARRALGPLKPADDKTEAPEKFLFSAKRTEAGRKLPAQHLVYFVLADLLGFRDLGRFEKLAWSIPVDWNGRAFLIEHRKFGVGVFAAGLERDEADAQKIVGNIHKSVKAARPYFEWLATKAVAKLQVNVTNKSMEIFDRFDFLRQTYLHRVDEAEKRKNERIVTEHQSEGGDKWESIFLPAMEIHRGARWLGISAVEAFFSWTEHVFIHIGILRGTLTSAREVARAAEADWSAKFKLAFDLSDERTKYFYDEILAIRKSIRNFVAHGSFGKEGEAFRFHSTAGAVPVLLPDPIGSNRYKFGKSRSFDVRSDLQVIDEFIEFVWEGPRAPAKIYIQTYGLPLILSMVHDGQYSKAMTSIEDMEPFADHLSRMMDNAVNMDW